MIPASETASPGTAPVYARSNGMNSNDVSLTVR
jgi:hypothetical protein